MASESKVVATLDGEKNNESVATSTSEWLPRAFPSSTIITILVGPDKHPFSAHKDVLTAKCPFFAKCFASGLEESASNTVSFPEDDSECFLLFFQWIYNETVPACFDNDGRHKMSTLVIFKAWLLADKLCMLEWQDRIMTQVMNDCRTLLVAPYKFLWLLENASQECMILRFIWDQSVWDLSHHTKLFRRDGDPTSQSTALDKGLEALLTSWPDFDIPVTQFFHEVLSEAKSLKTSEPATMGCKYHLHPADKPCKWPMRIQ